MFSEKTSESKLQYLPGKKSIQTMGANNQKTLKIQQQITSRYSQSHRKLNLEKLVDAWTDVLLFRDWSMLLELRLESCEIDDGKTTIFLKLKWPNLQTFSIFNNKITSTGLKRILKKGNIQKLKQLWLNNNSIGNEGMDYLVTSRVLDQIQEIRLDQNLITHEGMRMVRLGQFKQMKVLWLNDNKIGSKGMAMLVKAEIPLLETLFLRQCEIGNEGIKHLVKSNWPEFLNFSLRQNRFDFDGHNTLNLSNWRKVKYVLVNWFESQNQGIEVLCLLLTNWDKKTAVFYPNNLMMEIRNSIDSRFIRF